MKKNFFTLLGAVAVIVLILFVLVVHMQTPDTLEEKVFYAAGLGGDYLVRGIHEDGSYRYKYDVGTGTAFDSYNMLRHSGTTYALFELYEATEKKAYLDAANSAVAYLETTITACPLEFSDMLCAYDGEKMKLGGNALAILALLKQAEATGDTTSREIAVELAAWMKATQTSEGEFPIHIQMRDGTLDDHVSEYYPGEAIYALVYLYEATGNEDWLTSAESAADWLIDVRDKNETIATISHDHWLLYGLRELYLHSHKEKYLVHARKIVDGIIASQHIDGVPADWVGGYYTPPQSTPTATRSEGLGAAYTLFVEAGDSEYATKAYDALRRGMEFQLRTFIDGTLARTYPEPVEALGGFRLSLESTTVRIDYVQHNISSMLMYKEISKERLLD